MRNASLFLFAVVLIIALNSVPTSAKSVKTTAKPAPTTTTTTTTTAKSTTAAAKAPAKSPAAKTPSSPKGDKKKKKDGKKSKKPKTSPWKMPDAEQKKLFNDYKTILRNKLNARNQNISATYQLEPAKHGSQKADKSILHHFLIKLPDSKYAHAIIGVSADGKKTAANENNASIRRTIYENLDAAEA